MLPFSQRKLETAVRVVWARIYQKVIEHLGRDPVRQFTQILVADVRRFVDVGGRLPAMKKTEAKRARGFIKRRKDGKSVIWLPTDGFARLAPVPEPVLLWLEGKGFLRREGSGGKGGKSRGKRQVKVVVARDKKGKRVRLRVYEIAADLKELERLARAETRSVGSTLSMVAPAAEMAA